MTDLFLNRIECTKAHKVASQILASLYTDPKQELYERIFYGNDFTPDELVHWFERHLGTTADFETFFLKYGKYEFVPNPWKTTDLIVLKLRGIITRDFVDTICKLDGQCVNNRAQEILEKYNCKYRIETVERLILHELKKLGNHCADIKTVFHEIEVAKMMDQMEDCKLT